MLGVGEPGPTLTCGFRKILLGSVVEGSSRAVWHHGSWEVNVGPGTRPAAPPWHSGWPSPPGPKGEKITWDRPASPGYTTPAGGPSPPPSGSPPAEDR